MEFTVQRMCGWQIQSTCSEDLRCWINCLAGFRYFFRAGAEGDSTENPLLTWIRLHHLYQWDAMLSVKSGSGSSIYLALFISEHLLPYRFDRIIYGLLLLLPIWLPDWRRFLNQMINANEYSTKQLHLINPGTTPSPLQIWVVWKHAQLGDYSFSAQKLMCMNLAQSCFGAPDWGEQVFTQSCNGDPKIK